MKSILAELLYAMQKGSDTVLVTIIGSDGSTPRGTGSRMLVSEKGRLLGSVGGGAVEARCVTMAAELLARRACLLHEFSLRPNANEDIGMVCGGAVRVWFQFIAADDAAWKKTASEALAQMERHECGWLLQPLDGSAPRFSDGEGESLTAAYCGEQCGNSFVQPLPIGERAVIFGAGHIARALTPLLRSVGFRPIVFDCRPEYAVAADFPQAEQVVCGDYLAVEDSLSLSPEDYIVIMTSGHSHDFAVQAQILRKEFAYVGVIGSRRKTAAVNARLWEASIAREATARVHTPIGVAIQAVTPEEIAVSIAAEMISVRASMREDGAHHGCPMHA